MNETIQIGEAEYLAVRERLRKVSAERDAALAEVDSMSQDRAEALAESSRLRMARIDDSRAMDELERWKCEIAPLYRAAVLRSDRAEQQIARLRAVVEAAQAWAHGTDTASTICLLHAVQVFEEPTP